MAEALLSAVLEQLVSIITEFGKQELRLVKDVEKSVSKLQKKLEDIQAVLEDAERKQLDDPSVRRWLGKLKDVSYAINDVLDDWSSEILKSQIPNHVEEEEGDHHQKADLVSNKMMIMKKKVCFASLSCCFCLNQLKQVCVRGEIAHRIKELNETLDEIAKEKDAYCLEKTNNASPKERRETTSFVYEPDIGGRQKDKNLVISRLLRHESSDKGPVIIPIVGMGGLGKSTLAQLVFNHEKIKTHFNERIWVCVSDPFDQVGIARAIIESLKRSHRDLDTLQALSDRIRESIEGKKFLLVLDDVWTDDREKWEKLIQPLRCGAVGSKVLVTTRKTEVANMMGVTSSQIINPDLLSDSHCWKIIKRLAFGERNGEELKQLEGVGKEIAKKCKGLPLVAKALGGLLFSKDTLKEWEDILSSRLWELQDEESQIFAPFFLSFNDLSPRQKRCFSYCSVFPKDFEIERSKLIEMWMSQGYLSGGPRDMEKEGEKCFEILTMRSFFQDFERDVGGSIYSCKMHDILHDFSQFLTKNECSAMKVDMKEIEPLSVEKVRHFTFQTAQLDGFKCLTSTFHQNNLHTLLFFLTHSDCGCHGGDTLVFLRKCCKQKHLRALHLEECGITKVPEQLGQLIHLRYLNLSGNGDLEELPEEVCDLCNLQTLRMQGCQSLQRLPKGMGKLVNLRHLYCCGCDGLKGLPKGIGRLTQLRMLDQMIIPENNEAYLSLVDLKKLNHLRSHQTSFMIENCHNLISLGENEERVLMNWKCLVSLSLSFNGISDTKICEDEFGILETLQPPPGLKGLVIGSYMGTNLRAQWMVSLVHLKSLWLCDCVHVETLPPLGSLPSLEELYVASCHKVRKIGVEFLGNIKHNNNNNVSFPKLKLLSIWRLTNWEEWEGNIESTEHTNDAAGGAIIMPHLDSLELRDCDILKSLPEYLKLTPLKKLSIGGSEKLRQFLAQSEKEWLKISHIPNIEIDWGLAIRRDGKWDYDALPSVGVPRAFVHDGNEVDPS